ncbi:MAG TPA: tyrosine-type recombinase/integrase, partial [Steroidobacteraceae bacterium]|nr:tyrosine-type recombinase/integrase [Steroidobacteraceae bacterium]
LFASIPTATLRDLRDRALIATLTYSFARISAALKMKVEDLRPRGAGWTVRLHEKGGKQHAMPCHHALAEALRAYIDAAGIAEDRKGWLFRTARGHNGSALSDKAMSQPDAWRMIRRRAAAAGIAAEIGCHTFRATGITSPTAARSNTRKKWRRMRARAPPSSTTGRRSDLRKTKWRGFGCEGILCCAHLDDGERHRVFIRNRYLSGVLRTQCSKHYVRTRHRDVHLAEPPVGELKPGAAASAVKRHRRA